MDPFYWTLLGGLTVLGMVFCWVSGYPVRRLGWLVIFLPFFGSMLLAVAFFAVADAIGRLRIKPR